MGYIGNLGAVFGVLACCAALAQGESLKAVQFRSVQGPPLKIIHGNMAQKGQFPHQAGIYLDYSSFCGGSLINQRWVLTAGHCVSGVSTWTVYLGATNIMLPKEDERQAFVTRNAILHPEFDFPANDIALLGLARDAVLTDYIQVIRLPPSTSSSYIGSKATISGWGKTGDASFTVTPRLRYVSLDVVDLQVCKDAYDDSLDSGVMCTQGVGEKATCQGDSGGPLVVYDDDDDEAILIGATSFGSTAGCESGVPNGFANVAHYLPWISKTTNIPFV